MTLFNGTADIYKRRFGHRLIQMEEGVKTLVEDIRQQAQERQGRVSSLMVLRRNQLCQRLDLRLLTYKIVRK